MRPAKVSPMQVSTGRPAHSAGLAVAPALKGSVSRNKSATRWRLRCSASGRRWAKNEALRIDAMLRRLFAQVGVGDGIAREQPENAAFDLLEDPHPESEGGWADFVTVVEATEDEALLRQSLVRCVCTACGRWDFCELA